MPWVSPAVDHFRPAREYLKDVLGEEDAIGVKYIVGWQANDDVQGSRVHQTAADEFSPVEAWKTDMSIYELFMCSGCKRLASPSEIDEEVVSYYCTNCLEVLPQSAVTAHKGRWFVSARKIAGEQRVVTSGDLPGMADIE
ncbi:hypothetical protein Pmar_PMAR004510 [Perkinsus marinus ATCC 50983]|uniref:Uncharacterized protein n=1 Tax=Perkinsus marinus (strain ATCC 50983 / TXsc) TaxID=423536 RepID=C5LZV3_PERM5|nr:hypothetical protein Pmar_PMAR004510 [Perkinsus marinus ATCC 50983]EEQ97771.1 hypothetical protein Pmar_PMAR004510 [Perkinsus marinus ATCC 50983]|eukprot:XP_002765054.1 hypothetical protein Pmar_PMAR004510 [Perkinsus marinus ATCC 50983]